MIQKFKDSMKPIQILVLFLSLSMVAQAQEVKIEPIKQIKVLSFNAWLVIPPCMAFTSICLKLSADVETRIALMPDMISGTGADVIGFQEVWNFRQRQYLIEELRKRGYTYAVFSNDIADNNLLNSHTYKTLGDIVTDAFDRSLNPIEAVRGNMGNGLLVVSKYKLGKVTQLRFSEYSRGDEITIIKGAIRTGVEIPGYGWVDIVNAHLGAVGEDLNKEGRFVEYDPAQLSIRQNQSYELAQWMKRLGYDNPNRKLIMISDLNSHYHPWNASLNSYDTNSSSIEYSTFARTELNVPLSEQKDGQRCPPGSRKKKNKKGKSCEPLISFNFVDTYKVINGHFNDVFTFDSKSNTYASDGFFRGLPPEFIDYIFVNSEKHFSVLDSKLVFTDPLGEPQFLSDHFGVLTTLQIN